MAFGKIIQKWRRARNYSQSHLGQLCALDRTYISMIENGKKHVSIKTVFSLCKALKVNPSEIIRQTERELDAKKRRLTLSSKRL